VEWGKITHAPSIHELPNAGGRERVISFEEEARYLSLASANLRDAAILAVDTGMRPNSELFLLDWADVELATTSECPYGVVAARTEHAAAMVAGDPPFPRSFESTQFELA
jgi:integrase